MRTGGGAALPQQQLAEEAAAAVRQAVSLARRRGHAQVTPLHVVSTVLPAATAALRTHTDRPLQCISALELCLGVALDRFPKAPDARVPAPSNALVAAFKRAQAGQRRGSSSAHGVRPHTGVLAVKVELEHLVVSILDDPSVNRVIREAGLSSSRVWASVEKAAVASSTRLRGLPNAASRSGAASCRRPKFTELTAENLKILCTALETRVPWHKDIVPDIAGAVLQRRSGMARKRSRPSSASATWLVFQGRDSVGKKAMAQELAKLVFGSYAAFTSITTRTELTTPGCSSTGAGDLSLQRKTSPDNDHGGHVLQRLYEAIRDDPHRVMMIEDGSVEKLDHDSETGIRDAIAKGRVRGCNNGDAMIGLEDAIIVLAYDGQREEELVEKEVMKPCLIFDLNTTCAEDFGEDKEKSLVHGVEILDAVDGIFFFGEIDD